MDRKNLLRPVILAVLSALLLFGFSHNVTDEVQSTVSTGEYIVLRILTESTTPDGMRSQISEMMSSFEAAHDHVNLILDVLPAEGLERQKAISQIYVDIANGTGPDIYLLPNGSTIPVSAGGYLTKNAEPLFESVTEHMYRGTFADISDYYDADADLEKDELVTSVMDAGLVGDARYALPLRYSIPVVYGDRDALGDTILTEEILNEGIDSIMLEIIRARDAEIAACVDPMKLHSRYMFNFFSEIMDYENGVVALEYRDLSPYLKQAALIRIWASREEETPGTPHVGSYISMGDFFANNGFPLTVGAMESALDAAAIAKTLGIDLAMIPLRGVHGDLVADVTWFGAVGADCAHVDVAYEFLRMFLSEDAQYEVNRSRSTYGFQSGFIAQGWPVRARGSAEYLWQNIRFQLGFYVGQDEDWQQRAEALKQVTLTDADLDGLLAEPDLARFSNAAEGIEMPDYISHVDLDHLGYTLVEEVHFALEAQMKAYLEGSE